MSLNTMKIFFRVDASIKIGTGHVMRCLALADELRRQGHQCLFICRNHEGHLGNLITQKDFELHVLHTPKQLGTFANDKADLAHSDWLEAPWQTDAEQTLRVLMGHAPDWLIVDHYGLDAKWERSLVHAVGHIMAIDDLADREHDCALLLDQNLGREPSDYETLVPPTCKQLIGPKYALLRTEFTDLRSVSLKRRRSPKLKRILISMGGVDRTNVTGKVLKALSNSGLPPETELDIVMGNFAPHLEAVKKQASKLSFQTAVSISVSDMANRMCAADFSIGGAGSTSWERCCLGLPSIMIVLANNQRLIATALEQTGCAQMSTVEDVDARIREVIQELKVQSTMLMTMSDKSQKVCDGQGCMRVVAVLSHEDNL